MLRTLMVTVLVVVVGCVAANAVLYGVARRVRRRESAACPFDDDEPIAWPARIFEAVRSFTAECTATLFLVATIPLAWRRRRFSADGSTGRPILLLGGRLAHPATFHRLARRLRRDGWQPVSASGWRAPWNGVEQAARGLGDAIERIRRMSRGGDLDVIAHGTGGLVARAHIQATAYASGIARLITLGTPHQGTAMWPTSRLRPGAALITRLAEDDRVPAQVETIAIYSRDDAVVVPTALAYYPGAFNIELGAVGHLSLLFSPRVYALVHENLTAEVRAPSPAAVQGG